MAFTPLVQYKGLNDGQGPSPNLWADLPRDIQDRNVGVSIWDDFLTAVSYSTNTEVISEGGVYTSYVDTSNTIANLVDETGGVLALTTDNTDNDETWLESGSATSVLGKISDTAGDDRKLWFEARVKVSEIADSKIDWFIGLAEEGLAAADTITDGDAMASKDFIGFRVLADDGDAIDAVYRKAGQAEQEVKSGAGVPVADTFIKLGFHYNPKAETAKRITFYVDGVEQNAYVTGTNIAAATFPDGEELCFLAGLKNGTGQVNEFAIDWWRYAQLVIEG